MKSPDVDFCRYSWKHIIQQLTFESDSQGEFAFSFSLALEFEKFCGWKRKEMKIYIGASYVNILMAYMLMSLNSDFLKPHESILRQLFSYLRISKLTLPLVCSDKSIFVCHFSDDIITIIEFHSWLTGGIKHKKALLDTQRSSSFPYHCRLFAHDTTFFCCVLAFELLLFA